MALNIHPLPVISPAPRRAVRDQPETQAAYLTRTAAPASSAETTALALAHYTSELDTLTRPVPQPVDLNALADLLRSAIAATEAYLKRDIAISAIYEAGRRDTLTALGLS